MSLVSNVSVLKAEWFQKLNEGFWQVLAELAATSTGTFYQVKGKDGLSLIVLVTDLTSQLFVIAQTSTMKIERMGKTNVTVGAGQVVGFTTITLNPVLPEQIGNYVIFVTVNDNVFLWSGSGRLISTSQLTIRAFRTFNATISSVTGLTHAPTGTYPSDTQTDVGLGHQHQTDVNLNATHNHAITDPGHTHSVTNTNLATTINVDWMIVHV